MERGVRRKSHAPCEAGEKVAITSKSYLSLSERMEANGNTVIPLRSTLPETMYIYVESEDVIAIVNKGETGYSPTIMGEGLSPDEKTALTEKLNGKLGITQPQGHAMKAGSMFGFDKPAADPKNYTEDGKLIKTHKDRGDAR